MNDGQAVRQAGWLSAVALRRRVGICYMHAETSRGATCVHLPDSRQVPVKYYEVCSIDAILRRRTSHGKARNGAAAPANAARIGCLTPSMWTTDAPNIDADCLVEAGVPCIVNDAPWLLRSARSSSCRGSQDAPCQSARNAPPWQALCQVPLPTGRSC